MARKSKAKKGKAICLRSSHYGYVAGKNVKRLDKAFRWVGNILDLRESFIVWEDPGTPGERGSLIDPRRVKVTIEFTDE